MAISTKPGKVGSRRLSQTSKNIERRKKYKKDMLDPTKRKDAQLARARYLNRNGNYAKAKEYAKAYAAKRRAMSKK